MLLSWSVIPSHSHKIVVFLKNIFCYYFYRLSGRFIQIYVNKIFRSVFEDKVLSFLTVAGGWDREESQKTKCLELSSYEFVELMKGAWAEPGLCEHK